MCISCASVNTVGKDCSLAYYSSNVVRACVCVCVYVGLRARHPVMMGLKNCLHVAARNDVHHITVPLLLVHSMEPVGLPTVPSSNWTTQFSLSRAGNDYSMVFEKS